MSRWSFSVVTDHGCGHASPHQPGIGDGLASVHAVLDEGLILHQCCRRLLALAALAFISIQPALARPQPPRAGGGPVVVHVGLYSRNVGSVDDSKAIFEDSGTLYMHWKDPRLAFTAHSPGEHRQYQPGQIWTPEYYVSNLIDNFSIPHIGITAYPDGTVLMDENFTADLSWNFDFRSFPFDVQKLDIVVRPTTGEVEDVRFVPDPNYTGLNLDAYTQLPKWKVQSMHYNTVTRQIVAGPNPIDRKAVVFTITARRLTSFYVWKLFIPLLFIIGASWCTLWLKVEDLSNQIHVAYASLLSIIAFAFATENDVPLVAQMTVFDKFYFSSFALIILLLVEVMLIHILINRNRERVGLALRRFSRFAFPAITIAIAAGIWIVR